MKKLLLLLTLVLSPVTLASQNHLGLKIGASSIENSKDEDAGLSFLVDYAYQFHPNFSAEIGYTTASGISSSIITGVLGDTTESLSYSATFVGLKAHLIPVDFFNLYAVGGASYSNVEKILTPKSGGVETVDSYKGVNPYFGGGAELIFVDTLSLSLEYRRFILENSYESNALFAGVNFKF
ncbi:outer membrane beta-barrel protein [Vibrio nigripulchritudo]|uniref:outer membrane beta-barrel protein n=1 Tax=Vibrio nigripulchritudo TaxID=28173 RepID=UPI00249245F3|nr:outer membrane beta-barrel protein [Vibrio nigripulchritudo]BDU36739.1 hypothetical protein TUMSATVNIG2_12080 [Vibrio nigripulchritudo]BDU42449.1 hypothetical protein TUMSATVNIG3_12470 [Vibrio nigripulchritudo]